MEKQEYEGYKGVWRRLKSGAAIFIRDGEDIKSAVRRNYNSQKLENKKKEILNRDYQAFEKEQSARNDKMIAFREKGELSKAYEEASSRERSYKQEQDRLRQERYNVEDEQQRVTARNRFGMQIKKDQVEQLKKVGNVKQNLSDLRKAIKEHNEQNTLSSELDLGDQKAKFTDVYGYESMKDASQKIAGRLEQEKFGTYQTGQKVMIEDSYGGKPREAEVVREMNETDSRMLYGGAVIGYVVKDKYGEFNSNNRRMTPKEKAKAIDGANKKDFSKDAEIEESVRSLFIYQNEKNMGAGRPDPLKMYHDAYGKENVDRVWKQMKDKYEVIEGASMGSEGERYNSLIEKSDYNPSAIQAYKNKISNIYEKYWDSREYNKQVELARQEFERTGKANSYKGLTDKQVDTKNKKLESQLPADHKEASIKGMSKEELYGAKKKAEYGDDGYKYTKVDEEVQKYYSGISTGGIANDLERRIDKMKNDWYAPNDKKAYQEWNDATERYLRYRYKNRI